MVLHFIISVVIAWTGIRSEEPSFAPIIIGATAGKPEARSKEGTLYVQNLRCEMLVNPVGIDVEKPRLSWEITGKQRNVKQTAYQIMVSSSQARLLADDGDLWNSGKVVSDQSAHVSYGGTPLAGRTECFWKVKIWTEDSEHPWSEPAYWTMGLNAHDWQAKWIGLDRAFPWDSAENQFSRLSARYFRKEFETRKTVRKATAYIAGLGLYELYINGQRIGDQVLAPAPTDYTESVKYNTFDVTDKVKQGRNAVATVLGNGRYFTMRQAYKPQKIRTFGYPKMLLQVEIEYTDGERQTIISDDSWKVTADGPIRTNNEYDGEEYDATKEMFGWNAAGFRDDHWLKAEFVEEPGGKVQAQMNENMKVMETITPVAITELNPGKYIIDMGQNMVGWLRIKVAGKRGDKVMLRFAETLQRSGELYTENLRDAKVTDVYTLKGGGEETWEPSFVYHGFRYVEVTGFTNKPTVKNFEGRVVYDGIRTTGTFETSNATINQIYKNAFWGIRGNYKGMPIDCPQRNERQPWLGDRATGSFGESFVFDNAKLYAKWLDDIEQSQTAEGRIPDVAPNFWFYYKDNMTWPGTYLMVANMLYHQFGDRQPIADHYRSMKQWLVFMRARYMDDYIITKDSYGDWCVPPESQELIHAKDSTRKTDGALIATAYHYYLLGLMRHFATLLDKPKDAAEFATLSRAVKEAFNATFFNPQTSQYSNGTVTANILPLSFGMVPEDAREKVFSNIVDKIMTVNNGHISTGVIGTQWLMRGLTAHGRPDIAYKVAANRDYPSWGYMAEQGATTIWELWNGDTANPAMNSHNHVMLLGDLIVWYYENLAGIKSDAAHPGYKQLEMNPSLVDGLDFVKASYHSVHGLIRSEWKKKNKQFTWNITIPGNTQAIVYIPAHSAKSVMEGGKKISSANGIKFLRMEKDRAVIEVGSGEYVFTSALK
jgi:alpha-L-rhamnosidase